MDARVPAEVVPALGDVTEPKWANVQYPPIDITRHELLLRAKRRRTLKHSRSRSELVRLQQARHPLRAEVSGSCGRRRFDSVSVDKTFQGERLKQGIILLYRRRQ